MGQKVAMAKMHGVDVTTKYEQLIQGKRERKCTNREHQSMKIPIQISSDSCVNISCISAGCT